MGVGPANCTVCGAGTTDDVQLLRKERNTEEKPDITPETSPDYNSKEQSSSKQKPAKKKYVLSLEHNDNSITLDRTIQQPSVSKSESNDNEAGKDLGYEMETKSEEVTPQSYPKKEETSDVGRTETAASSEKAATTTTTTMTNATDVTNATNENTDVQKIVLDIDKSSVTYFTDLIRLAIKTGLSTFNEAGSVLPGICGVLWPNDNDNGNSNEDAKHENDCTFVINSFITQLNRFINEKSLKNDITTILKDIHNIKDSIDKYLNISYSKANEKTQEMNKLLDECNTVRKTLFQHKRGKYLLPLTILLATIDLSINLDIYHNGEKYFKQDTKFDKNEWLNESLKSKTRDYCNAIINQFVSWKGWRKQQFKMTFNKHKYPALYGFTATVKDRITKNTYQIGPLHINFNNNNEKDYCHLFKHRLINDEMMMYHFQCFSSMFYLPWFLPQFNETIIDQSNKKSKNSVDLYYISYYSREATQDIGDESQVMSDNEEEENGDNNDDPLSPSSHGARHGGGFIDNTTDLASAFEMADAEKKLDTKKQVLYQEIGPYLLQIKKPEIDEFVAIFPCPKYSQIRADHSLEIEKTDLTIDKHQVSKVTLSMGKNLSSMQFNYSLNSNKIDGAMIGTIDENSNVNNVQNQSQISGFCLKFAEYVANAGLPKPLFASQLDSIKFYYQNGSEIVMKSLPNGGNSKYSSADYELRKKESRMV